MKTLKKVLAFIVAISTIAAFSACKSNQDKSSTGSETEGSIEEIEKAIDYGDAESFEAALNEGQNLEGKIVRFIADELHPDSALGYNVWAGEHLNFISSTNPDIQEGSTVTVKAVKIESMLGSWYINYEKVDNAVMNEDTITYSKPKETTDVPTEEMTMPTKEYTLDSEYTLNGITFNVSSEWDFKEGENQDNCCYWYTNAGNFIMASCEATNDNFDENYQKAFLNGVKDSGFEVIEQSIITLPNIGKCLTFRGNLQDKDTTSTWYVFLINNISYTICGTENAGGEEGNLKYLYEVVDSIKVNEIEETEPEAEPPTEKEKISLGMRNALSKAKDYLEYSAFSYEGLIKQLEYEGYTNAEATYGADNCGADWNEQAAKKAQDYIDFTSFSRQGLIDQLLYEGFTEEQAEYGVEAVGY